MLTKIDVTGIVEEHANSLVDLRDGQRSWSDIALFAGLPILGAALLTWGGARLTPDGVSLLVSALSVFAGLLFNLLVLAHALRAAGNATRGPRERRFIREINVNLEYAILVSLVAIAVCLIPVFAPQDVIHEVGQRKEVVAWVSAPVIALTMHFMLTLLLILKRMHVVLGLEDGTASAPPRVAAREGVAATAAVTGSAGAPSHSPHAPHALA